VRRGVLVVGGSSPIGCAIARAFAADGDRVVGAALERVDEAGFIEQLTVDCACADGAALAVTSATQVLGRLDVVVLAAAVMPVASAVDTTDAQWRAAVDTVLGSAFYVSRAALRQLPRGGAIVAVTSVNATLAAPGVPAYAAAKAGVEGLVRQLALEYGPAGVRVNAVAPAMIGGDHLPKVTEGYPLQRTGRPADVAAAVRFLASEHAAFVTGAVLPVDGGLSIASPAAFLRPDLRARFLS
jgi:meso-butanediol dehydrogenase / (S,S)-butanediol dehydrogenase / diacetyl reductase